VFSWFAIASKADIAASYQHPDGEPIFDLRDARAFPDPIDDKRAWFRARKLDPIGTDAAIVVAHDADAELLADLKVLDELLAKSRRASGST